MIWVIVAVAVSQAAGDTAPLGATHTPSAVPTVTATATIFKNKAQKIDIGQPAPYTGVIIDSDHLATIVALAAEKQKTPRKPLWYEAAGCLGNSIVGGYLLYREVKK